VAGLYFCPAALILSEIVSYIIIIKSETDLYYHYGLNKSFADRADSYPGIMDQ